MGYQVLAGAALVTHVVFLTYVVFGGFLAWRWPRAIWPHLAAAGWGLAVVALRLPCPLTHVENWARGQVGEPELAGGFIDQYIEGVLYPQRYAALMQLLAATVVAASWAGAGWRVRRAGRRPVSAR